MEKNDIFAVGSHVVITNSQTEINKFINVSRST